MTGGRGAVLLAGLLLVAGCAPAPGPARTGGPSPATSPRATPSAAAPPTGANPSLPPVGSKGPSASTAAAPTGWRHVYLIVMENHGYDAIVGSAKAPYENGLIARYGLVTGLHATTHPSEPNYIALTSGGVHGVTSDGVYDLDVPSLFDQVEASGRTWHVYAQGYPGSCFTGALAPATVDGPGQAGEYVRKHDPAISYTSISRNPSRCARITGLAGFDPAAADLELIVPNQVNDMHSSSIAAGDAFLAAFVPSIIDSPAFADSILFITWDEGTSNTGGGGHVATIAVGPGIEPGSRFGGSTTHYSILRSIETAWGLPLLGAAATAQPIFP
jgi:phosphatidylinositol-3-phosphatase